MEPGRNPVQLHRTGARRNPTKRGGPAKIHDIRNGVLTMLSNDFSKPVKVYTRQAINQLDPIKKLAMEIRAEKGIIKILEPGEAI